MSTEVVVTDGSGERYRVLAYSVTFTLKSERTGAVVQADSATLRGLGLEWDGRCLREVGDG